jgi:hypothetical protein
MESEGSFDTCSTLVRVPRPEQSAMIQQFVNYLAEMKVLGRLLESDKIHTLSHLPYFVSILLNKFDPNKECDSATANAIRQSLYDSVERRLGKHINDANQPSLMAAMMSPPYSNRLTDFGVSLPVLKAVHANLNKWIEDTPDAATPAEPAAERPTTALFGDDDDDDNHNNSNNNNNAIIDTKNLLKTALKELSKQSTMARYPLPRLSLEGDNNLLHAVEHVNHFYNQPTFKRLIPLASRVFSLLGSSAIAEQAFSASGRTHTPLRNRMHPDTLEKITGTTNIVTYVVIHFPSML